METLVLIVALITLLVALSTLCFVVIILRESVGFTLPDLTIPFTKKTTNTPSKDAYTPDYADQTTPIEDFEPDFSRPLTVKVGNGVNKKEFTTGEGEEMTPIQTDDLQEEEDEDKR